MTTQLHRLIAPRVMHADASDALPLLDVVDDWLASHKTGAIEIVGGHGAGKTTALVFLFRAIEAGAAVKLIDEPASAEVWPLASVVRVIYATLAPLATDANVLRLRLAAWERDDWIEYVLAVHPEACRSVIERLSAAPDRDLLSHGVPELCAIALDCMAADNSIRTIADAFRVQWRQAIASVAPVLRTVFTRMCLDLFVTNPEHLGFRPEVDSANRLASRLAKHRKLALVVAADHLVDRIRTGSDERTLTYRLARELVLRAAERIRGDAVIEVRLRELAVSDPTRVAMVASILHHAGAGWRPPLSASRVVLDGAHLDGVAWHGVELGDCSLRRADLSRADLAGARIDGATADGARFASASLAGASLIGARLSYCNFSRADLSGATLSGVLAGSTDFTYARLQGAKLDGVKLIDADLNGASFTGANLDGARFGKACLSGPDFSGASLRRADLQGLKLSDATWTGATFAHATLTGCDLEGMTLADADFEGADLTGAHLSGSIMPRAYFAHACLRNAGLADIQWENADLRGADLRYCSFHLGSSRSGLVGSPIASEGSRTGFYTDEREEMHFKHPEQIRKANLVGADLRGARIDDTDFYLVDLRGAKYDRDQEAHFRRCRAILE